MASQLDASLHPQLLGGAIAGTLEHCLMFPFDSVKTRVQSLMPCPEERCRTPIHAVISVARREGIWRPFRGMAAIATACVPAHALYYTVYEKLKIFLTQSSHSHSNTFYYAGAGMCASMFHDVVMNPAEVVKQRMQMASSPYANSWDCVKTVYRAEGLRAFYRSYSTQIIMNIPFQALHFTTYEFFQQMLNPNREYCLRTALMAGSLAGGFAAIFTIPLDCIKTVLNTQQRPYVDELGRVVLKAENSYNGIPDAAKSIYQTRGLMGFTRGLPARLMYQIPGMALSWSIYESCKWALQDLSPT